RTTIRLVTAIAHDNRIFVFSQNFLARGIDADRLGAAITDPAIVGLRMGHMHVADPHHHQHDALLPASPPPAPTQPYLPNRIPPRTQRGQRWRPPLKNRQPAKRASRRQAFAERWRNSDGNSPHRCSPGCAFSVYGMNLAV